MLFSQEILMKLQHRTFNYLSPILFLLLGTILPAAQAQLTPGRIPKVTSTFPRLRIADSLISEDGSGIHIGAMSIAPTGEVTFCCGQGFGAGAWSLNGNAGTNCTASPCSNFLGTNDNSSVEIRVDGQRAYRIEPATASSVSGFRPDFAPNIIGGNGNYVTSGVAGATIAGGGSATSLNSGNSVTDDFGTVSGGFGNRAGDAAGTTGDTPFATVAGGYLNTASGYASAVTGGSSNTASGKFSIVAEGVFNAASGPFSTVAGGTSNTASGDSSIVGGGNRNTASGYSSVVAGGGSNTASGYISTVGGGAFNTASGNSSFAAGFRANTNNHTGAFVWGDTSSNTDVTASADNQFVARATGGVIFYTTPDLSAGVSVSSGSGSWSSLSDRNVKANFAAVDGRQLLARVLALPISTWNYKTQAETIRHIGPMAQDFYAAFNIGEDEKHITTIDEGGVALAAIQGLNHKLVQELEKNDARLAAQQQQIKQLQQQVSELMKRASR